MNIPEWLRLKAIIIGVLAFIVGAIYVAWELSKGMK